MSKAGLQVFRPHPLMRCPHRQTVLGVYLPSVKFDYQAVQHEVACDNGDTLVMHDDCPDNWVSGDRCAVALHGLVGCHASPYMQRVAFKLYQRGIRVFRLDLRGHGASAMAQAIGHAGRSEDAFAAVSRIEQLAPQSPITMIGFSMGGNIVLKAAGESGNENDDRLRQVDQLLAVSPPVNLRVSVENMARGINRWYDRFFAKWLCKLVEARQERFPDLYHQDLNPKPTSIVDFDNRFTAPLSGFEDANDYYEKSSALRFIDHLTIPTWILASRDDPLIPFSIYDGLEQHPFIELHAANHGGHLGFIGRQQSDPDRRWMDWRIVERVGAAKDSGVWSKDASSQPESVSQRASEA